jgi:hypothetical protein
MTAFEFSYLFIPTGPVSPLLSSLILHLQLSKYCIVSNIRPGRLRL